MSQEEQINSQPDLYLSDLDASKPNPESHSLSLEQFQASQIEFATNMASTNMEIEATREDLQQLMSRAHAICTNIGVATGSPLLSSTPPRHRYDIYSPSSTKKKAKYDF